MHKQEILKEINKTKKQLANLEKMLEECEYERWVPADGERYYFLDTYGSISSDNFYSSDYFDSQRYQYYNCFQTREEAEQEAEKILVRRMLEDIAKRLNKGKEIDWYDSEQSKYCIELYCNNIIMNFYLAHKTQGVVYCLDMNFYKVAIQEIGEERLKKCLRGE